MASPAEPLDVAALAARAVAMLDAEGQVTVIAERERVTLAFTAVEAGRGGRTTTSETTDDHLRRAARGALLRARQSRAWPAPPLPEPQPVRPLPEPQPGIEVARVAVASTTGIRAEQALPLTVAAEAGPALEVRDAEPREPDAIGTVVLGPAAVAAILDGLRGAFGVDVALGAGPPPEERVAAPIITLTDDAGHPETLQRAFDDEGVPRRRVTLIERGIARGPVHDSASAHRAGTASTGHATRAATLAPAPDHLVLEAGDAPDAAALCADVTSGLWIPALDRDGDQHTTRDAAAIRDGRAAHPVPPLSLRIDPLAALAQADALTAQRWLRPWRSRTPGGLGAALVPALRTHGGIG